MIRQFAAALAAKLKSRAMEKNVVNLRLSELERGQVQLNTMIQEFMTETEKVLAELSRLNEVPKKRAGKVDAKYHVAQLSRQGKRPEEISAQLSIPTGEVELILNLQRGAAKSAVAK
jgi:hypothetical protein